MDSDFLFVPFVLFTIFVAPIWVIMHYRSKRQKENGISEADHNKLQELMHIADKMLERVETLEAILDDETPGWRRKHERR
ncbi:envelope stress response membrane protein PspB [Aliikangiella sp. IMCC44653]